MKEENIIDFCHLHTHDEFSTLDGINRVTTLPSYAKSLGMSALAQTNHGNLVGAYKFNKECIKADIKPIIGLEAYYSIEDRTVRAKDEFGENYYHLILLAYNDIGLKNLFKLSTFSYTTGFYHKPRVDDTLLAECSEGIIATSACLGSAISQMILKDNPKLAEKILLHHAAIFKDKFLIELQLHEGEQEIVNKVLIKLAKKHNLPLIVSQDSHYTQIHHKELHENALCMATNTYMYDEKRFSFGEIDVHFASGDWMQRGAAYFGMPEEVITNTIAVADTIDASLYFNDIINRYPVYPNLPEGMSSHEALENLTKSKLDQKFKGAVPEEYKKRLQTELKMLKKLNFSDYLLIQTDFINLAKEINCAYGPGRGSAAGLLTAYALGITDVDPIKYGLIAERFANEGRAGRPKIF